MTDQPKRSRWKRRAVVAFVALLPVQYILGAGPILWLEHRGHLPASARSLAWIVYAPVRWAARHSPVVQRFTEWYGDLWRF